MHKKIYDPKEPQSFCLDAEDIKKINNFIEQIKPNIEEQIDQLDKDVDRETPKDKSDERKIDDLVTYINGGKKKASTIKSPKEQSTKTGKTYLGRSSDIEQDSEHDPDKVISD